MAVVLAAGLGTRMRSRLPKVLHPICGRPMLGYVLDAARTALDGRPLVVVSPAANAVREAFTAEADFAVQDEPRGTGDAVRAALAALPEDVEELVVLSGDVPLLDPALVDRLRDERRRTGAAVVITAVDAIDPGDLGRVVRTADGAVERIVEVKDASADERSIGEVNAGLYAFDAAWLRRRIQDLEPSPTSGELYLTDMVALARADGRAVSSVDVVDDRTLDGINDRSQLAEARVAMQARINEAHLLAGVTLVDPTTAYVDTTVELARDVTVEPNVILAGRTRIGEGTVIGAGSQVFDSVVGRDCRIWASIVESSEIEDEVRIGPFSHLRPGSSIGRGAELGNYAEVKNSRLEPGTKSHHVSYLGDAHLGAGTNVGAGTITANYDGRTKNRTRIGERVFLGVDTMLVAPVEIGDGAKTGAGAVVTRDIPAGKLAYGVPARVHEPGSGGEPGVPAPTADEADR